MEEMNLGKTGIVDEKTAPRVGRLVGAENLVVGNLTWGINAGTSVAATSEAVVKGTAMCSEKQEDFFKLPCCIVREVVNILDISSSLEELNEACIPHTKNYDSFIYFGKGLGAFDAGNWQEAKNLFKMALKEDPLFMLAKRWADTCPDPKSPSISELKNMKGSGLADHAESTYYRVLAEQRAAEEEKKLQDSDDGGGGH